MNKFLAAELQHHGDFMAGVEAMNNDDAAEAVRCLEAAVDSATKLELADLLVRNLLALGDAYRMSGRLAQAETALHRAIECSQVLTDDPLAHAFSLGALGKLFLEKEAPNKAEPYLKRCVDILRRNRADADPEFFMLFIAMTICYLEMGESEKADKQSRYALDFAKEVIGTDDLSVLLAKHYCALCADAIGKPRRAHILRSQVRTRIEEIKRYGAPDVLEISESLFQGDGPLVEKPVVWVFDESEDLVFDT